MNPTQQINPPCPNVIGYNSHVSQRWVALKNNRAYPARPRSEPKFATLRLPPSGSRVVKISRTISTAPSTQRLITTEKLSMEMLFISRNGGFFWCLLIVITSICYQLPPTRAIWLNLPSSGTKCVSEEIQNNVVVLADYLVIDQEGHGAVAVSAKVTSPYGNSLHHKENVTHGQFAFTTSEFGSYLACFWVDGNHEGATLNLEWKIGIAAKDWDSVAKKEKIEGVEFELRILEGVIEDIRENLLYMKSREAEMTGVSEKTNKTVARFSIMSVGISIVVSAMQVWHLKRFFQKKKLI